MLGFLRLRMLPWLVWLAAASSAAWLWHDQRTGPALGYVQGVSHGVTAIEPGRIATVTVQPGQRVQAGEVIAALDDVELEAELAGLAAERRRMEAELQATAVETRLRAGDSSGGDAASPRGWIEQGLAEVTQRLRFLAARLSSTTTVPKAPTGA